MKKKNRKMWSQDEYAVLYHLMNLEGKEGVSRIVTYFTGRGRSEASVRCAMSLIRKYNTDEGGVWRRNEKLATVLKELSNEGSESIQEEYRNMQDALFRSEKAIDKASNVFWVSVGVVAFLAILALVGWLR